MGKKRKTKNRPSPVDWTCPVHGKLVEHRIRTRIDPKSAKRKYAGEYYACPEYSECKYYISLNGRVSIL